jgi:hypothetical protein
MYGIDIDGPILKKKTGRWLRWKLEGLIGEEKSRAYLLMKHAQEAEAVVTNESDDDEDVSLPSWVPIQQ